MDGDALGKLPVGRGWKQLKGLLYFCFFFLRVTQICCNSVLFQPRLAWSCVTTSQTDMHLPLKQLCLIILNYYFIVCWMFRPQLVQENVFVVGSCTCLVLRWGHLDRSPPFSLLSSLQLRPLDLKTTTQIKGDVTTPMTIWIMALETFAKMLNNPFKKIQIQSFRSVIWIIHYWLPYQIQFFFHS